MFIDKSSTRLIIKCSLITRPLYYCLIIKGFKECPIDTPFIIKQCATDEIITDFKEKSNNK
jgi:hypothetical protein